MSIFSGDLAGLGMGPMLQMLERARSTGILTVTSGEKKATFSLREGEILWASSNFSPKLGEALVLSGVLTENSLAIASRDQAMHGASASLGTVIVALGLATRDEVAHELEMQIVCTLREAMRWTDGDYDLAAVREKAKRKRSRQRPGTAAISDLLMRLAS